MYVCYGNSPLPSRSKIKLDKCGSQLFSLLHWRIQVTSFHEIYPVCCLYEPCVPCQLERCPNKAVNCSRHSMGPMLTGCMVACIESPCYKTFSHKISIEVFRNEILLASLPVSLSKRPKYWSDPYFWICEFKNKNRFKQCFCRTDSYFWILEFYFIFLSPGRASCVCVVII